MESLIALSLYGNYLTEFPSFIFGCKKLVHLDLSSNSITGPIPVELKKLPKLQELILSGNNFTGSIRHDIGLISGLKTLELIPSQLGLCTNLEALLLQNNNIRGSLPPSLAASSRTLEFYIFGNRITGAIPWWIFTNWTNLRTLSRRENSFIGPIPLEIGLLKNLRWLDIISNKFSGHIPLEIGNLSKLVYLNLRGNHLIGSLPSELCNLKAIEILDLSSNNFHGQLFPDYHPQDKKFLYASNNIFGNIPVALSQNNKVPNVNSSIKCMNISRLKFPNQVNRFSSSIPRNIGQAMPNIRLLNVSTNGTTGSIPNSIGDMMNLTMLDLAWNKLMGPNHLSGKILDKIHKMRVLENLDLSNNLLSGEIPSNMPSLTFLGTLNLSFNNLSGPIPYSGHMSTFDASSYYGNPHLCGPLLPLPEKKCTHDESISNSSNSRNMRNGSSEIPWMSVGLEFGFGFSGLFSVIFVPRNNLFGRIPYRLGKLKQASFLDFGDNHLISPNTTRFLNMESLTDLFLYDNSLTEFASFIFGCKKLVHLDLSYNSITGPIPIELKKLTKLQELILSKNKFTGSIPHDIGLISGLKTLDLAGNDILGGHIPASLGQLRALEHLYLMSCGLNSSSPSQLGLFANLKYLYLSLNNLAGSLPPSLAALSRISDFFISSNSITDAIPGCIFTNWTNLRNLALARNSFIGPIPREIGLLKNLRWLLISFNKFSRHIPMEIWNLTNLEFLEFASNELNGTLPSSIRNLSKLVYLNLYGNHLTGSIPTSIGDMVNLTVFDLAGNKLIGPLRTTLGNLIDLKYLNLSNNTLLGKIPASLRYCSKLKSLDLGENQLSGNIPTWIGKSIKSFYVLCLRSNMFNGTIPRGISHLCSLQVLDLALNNLSGVIPAIFNNLTPMIMSTTPEYYMVEIYTYLGRIELTFFGDVNIFVNGNMQEYNRSSSPVTTIDFSSNNLSERIPDELTRLSSLLMLNLSHNHLSGKIPDKIHKMRGLEELDLSNNLFSGEIPLNMPSLIFLGTLNLSFNNLSGPNPYSGQMTTFDASSYYGNPQVCGPPLPLPEKKCTRDESISNSSNSRDMRNGSSEIPWMSICFGFGFGFGGFFSVIFVLKKWSHSVLEWMDCFTAF
ncbi:LRR receptor-like serine/threonine-protein kinase GSO2 [Amborella trichopoda]|nr:LRR receptor-like serine/threonine-protein kinase GSO2 [Amborella trichopoda]|eukprot:XP_020530429.1 LRR receptor-like serine/threonine-protein kinase GSO2 [Amborella trichopoda]